MLEHNNSHTDPSWRLVGKRVINNFIYLHWLFLYVKYVGPGFHLQIFCTHSTQFCVYSSYRYRVNQKADIQSYQGVFVLTSIKWIVEIKLAFALRIYWYSATCIWSEWQLTSRSCKSLYIIYIRWFHSADLLREWIDTTNWFRYHIKDLAAVPFTKFRHLVLLD